MGLFDAFRKKNEQKTPNFNVNDLTNFSSDDIPQLPEEPPHVSYLNESVLEDRESLMQSSFRNTTLEGLCKKIDSENVEIEKQVSEMRKKIKSLNLNNPEVVDLLDLYDRSREKLNDFVREVDRFDSIGWGTDENTAALYKFRACKGLANIKKKIRDIERLSKEAGFSPQKVQEILKTPASKLVDELTQTERRKK